MTNLMRRQFARLALLLMAAQFAAFPANGVVLKEGTEVPLKFAEAISSKTAQIDDAVSFTVDEDVKVGDTVVIKAGAKALGIVSNAKKAGMMGKAGELNVRLDYVRVADAKVKLRGTKAREGEDKLGTAVVLTVLLGPVGLVKHGKDINIPAGQALKAFVADDVTVQPAN